MEVAQGPVSISRVEFSYMRKNLTKFLSEYKNKSLLQGKVNSKNIPIVTIVYTT